MIQGTNPEPALRQASTSLRNAAKADNPGESSLGKEDFLNLLMAQVTNQDPLNPMDSEGMMNQVTSMGSLEQLVNLNKEMAALNLTQREIAQSNAYSFLDKDVTIRGGSARLTGGSTQALKFALPREATDVNVFISTQQGDPVRTLKVGQSAPGEHRIDWNGRDDAGEPLPDGNYRYSVVAKSPDNESIPVELFTRGRVSGVKFMDGKPVVLLNGDTIDLHDVLEISNASERTFSHLAPRPLQEHLAPRPPIDPDRE